MQSRLDGIQCKILRNKSHSFIYVLHVYSVYEKNIKKARTDLNFETDQNVSRDVNILHLDAWLTPGKICTILCILTST